MSDSRLDYEIQETNLAPFFFKVINAWVNITAQVCVRAEREKWFTLMELQKEKEMEGCSLVRLDVLLILMYTYEHIRLCMYILRLGSAQTTSSIRMLCFFSQFFIFYSGVCVCGDPAHFSPLPPPLLFPARCAVWVAVCWTLEPCVHIREPELSGSYSSLLPGPGQ